MTRGSITFRIPASLDMPPYCFVETTADSADGTMRSAVAGVWRAGQSRRDFGTLTLPTITQKAVAFIERYAKSKGLLFFLYWPLTRRIRRRRSKFVGKSGVGAYGDFVRDGRLRRAVDER